MSRTPFITANDAMSAFDESRKWYKPYDEPISEFERLQRNRPSERIDPSLPKVTDGTLAAINQENPKRVVQQVPTGIVTSKDHTEFEAIGNYCIQNKLIPLSHIMGSEIQKAWSLISKTGTVGHASTYCYYTSCNGEMYVEWILPYEKDILGEKGKTYIPDSTVRFMRAWYSKRDLMGIINKEKALMAKDKSYKSDWDLQLLANFMEAGASAKPAELLTPAEREKGGDTGGFEVIHAFQQGKGAEFYSFAPRYQDGQTLRTRINPDPRGKMPFDDMYWNIDHSNPRGRGQIELSGGIQNLIDQQMQLFQFNSTYLQAPALKVWGNVNKASLKIKMNTIWDMGSNPNNKVERDLVDNTAIDNFPNNYGLLKSQIMNLNSSQDHSISAEAGNPNQSKTQAGVKAQEDRLGVSDNYVRKQFEEAWGNMTETRLNIYLAEMKGSAKIKLEGDDLKVIQKSASARYLDDKSVLTIPYREIEKVAFNFAVDASSSEVKEDADNAEKLTEVLKLIQTSPNPNVQQKETQVLKLLIDEIGAEGTDDLFPELQENQDGNQPVQPQGADPQMIAQMVNEAVQNAVTEIKKAGEKPLHESLGIKFETLSPDVQKQLIAQLFNIQPQEPTASEVTQSQKQQEIDIKASQAQADVMLRADKQAHDTELALQGHIRTGAESEFNHMQADRTQTFTEKQAEREAKLKARQPAGAK